MVLLDSFLSVLFAILAVVLALLLSAPLVKMSLKEIGFFRWLEYRMDRNNQHLREIKRLSEYNQLLIDENTRLREELHVIRYGECRIEKIGNDNTGVRS